MRAAAILLAAGSGSRVGGSLPKQFRPVAGLPMIVWSIRALASHPFVDELIVVTAPERFDEVRALAGTGAAGRDVSVRLCPGGALRTFSVRAGLEAISRPADSVLIHDAARPGLTGAVIDRLLGALQQGLEGVAPALPVADALKRCAPDGTLEASIAREGLRRVQTPQAFRLASIQNAYARLDPDASFDDDLDAAAAAGLKTGVVAGDHRLMKATYPEDLAILERLLCEPLEIRVGLGVDAHRFGPGDHVALCGVKIPFGRGLIGHSDADAAWHALTDALLGAIGAGDIGAHFPPSDPQWRGAPSEVFLRHAARLVEAAGARVVHVDVTVMCEGPKIHPHREAMRERTAAVLALPLSAVSVKATTTERMGFLGREEGLAAQAVASVEAPRRASAD